MINGLGERLTKLRMSRGLLQKQVGDAIGVSAAVVSNYENSERTPSAEKLLALSVFFRCSTDYLLGIDKKPQQLDCSMLNEEQYHLLQSFMASMTFPE